MKSFLKFLVQITWGLPQTLIGFILFLIVNISGFGKVLKYENGVIYTLWNSNQGSISLGLFVFVTDDEAELIAHETGHTVQSLLLGPLYLFIIGLPSILWAGFIFDRTTDKTYYDFYTEAWANKIAGLDRNGEFIKEEKAAE